MACLMALNMSSNFSCPDISSTTLLLSVNVTPSFSSTLTMVESLVGVASSAVAPDSINAMIR